MRSVFSVNEAVFCVFSVEFRVFSVFRGCPKQNQGQKIPFSLYYFIPRKSYLNKIYAMQFFEK
ncbi:hypothetical protein McpCs1_13060 [Methanocorpusculaceae archaeon Cs1]|uniref:Uncharacterized protein n=1 Tax=Methanorbis rubei TaxID=3028300 RepID=A0AAE4MGP6_9EURY|nr:hypothetical protein [Methanocorpusculaceae archaeon Cs1]